MFLSNCSHLRVPVNHVLWTSLKAPPDRLDRLCLCWPHLLETRDAPPTHTSHPTPIPLPFTPPGFLGEKDQSPHIPAIYPKTHYSL